ncbi:glycosyltransferase [Lysobacter cavernae]|uniref:Glycosyltransferase n=1 Tax=Lysobacter cavernae TaxID=1685901 RepID=A0ABV7RS51_9GAMM
MRKIRVAVIGHDLKFWRAIQAQLERTGHYEFREDEWENHDVHDSERTLSAMAWADVVVAEWALGNAVFCSHHKLPHQKLVIRLHLQERGTAYPAQVDWANVDQVVFVGPHILRECVDKFAIPPGICRVLGNFVDCDSYALAKLDGAEFTLGMIGTAPSRKRLDRALDVLEVLMTRDDRYTLRVKGESPAGHEWLWERLDERAYYETVYRRINSNPVLRHRVIFDPPANDVQHWLRLVGSVVSSSDFESFHMAVAEGAASGALPIVWRWEGAEEIYPELALVDSTEVAADQVESVLKNEAGDRISAIRDAVRARYGVETVIGEWDTMLRAPASGSGYMPSTEMRVHMTAPRANRHHVVAKELSGLKVALLCDEFTYNSFKDEFQSIVIEPDNWRALFERDKPDLFFCESAWSGVDSVRRPWKGRVYTSTNFKNENRGELLAILEYCRENGIPTVFWNKEDPSHYDDKIHNFVDTARCFDVVFTTDVQCVERYKRDHGLRHVYCLPFATNPRIFNPVEVGPRSDDVVFAGSWYAYHVDRSTVMRQIFDAVIASGRGLVIYDRFFGGDDPNHLFPEEYRQYTRPAVPHSEIDKIYKSSVFGLNLNTETQSPTMFARRVFELMSCNTLCLTNHSVGMERMFDDTVVFLDRDPDALAGLSLGEIDDKRTRALRDVLRNHTYKERFKTILRAVNIPFVDRGAQLTVACVVDSHAAAQTAIAYFNRQAPSIPEAGLLLVLAESILEIEAAHYYEKYNRLGVAVLSWNCLERYMEKPAAAIKTNHFALVDPAKSVVPDYIGNAFLHTSYAGDAILAMGQDGKYRYTPDGEVGDVIADSRWFLHLLRNRGKTLQSRFYAV